MQYYDWDWYVIWQYRDVLAYGVILTLLLTGISVFIGTILGGCLGTLLSIRDWFSGWQEIRAIILVIIDIVRALPILILLLVLYYWLPYFISLHSPFWIAVLALSVNLGSFVADVLRSAIDGFPKPLVEAGEALGMDMWTIRKRITIPEAMRQVIPSIALLYIHILKMSSLASVVAVPELVHASAQISTKTYRYLEVYASLAFIYILLVLPFSIVTRRLESSEMFIRRS